jgi:hypothetical protein
MGFRQHSLEGTTILIFRFPDHHPRRSHATLILSYSHSQLRPVTYRAFVT